MILIVFNMSIMIEGMTTESLIINSTSSSTTVPSTTPRYTLPDRCLVKTDLGPCKNWIHKWSFNKTSGKCITFAYGGCLGNENRFHSQQECLYYCVGGPNSKLFILKKNKTNNIIKLFLIYRYITTLHGNKRKCFCNNKYNNNK